MALENTRLPYATGRSDIAIIKDFEKNQRRLNHILIKRIENLNSFLHENGALLLKHTSVSSFLELFCTGKVEPDEFSTNDTSILFLKLPIELSRKLVSL
jgi:hypothetical protein